LGKALNEAYRLESQVSLYPRVAVSRKVYEKIGPLASTSLFLTDEDGITHLNYFEYMIESSGNPPGKGSRARRETWLTQLDGNIAKNVARFEQAEDWKKLAKWAWFKKRIEEARSKLSEGLFKESLPQALH